MFEKMNAALTTEAIVAGTLIILSLAVIVVSLIGMRSPRPKHRDIDIEAVVRDAPYHRLKDVFPDRDS